MVKNRLCVALLSALLTGAGLLVAAAPAAALPVVQPALPPGGSFVPVAPLRALDTRVTGGPVTSTSVPVGALPGVDPADVAALLVNVTVVGARSSGFVVVGSGTGTSNGNFIATAPSATLALARVSHAAVAITVSSPADVVADIQGYVTTRAAADSRSYTPLAAPRRVADSRSRAGLVPFAAGQTQSLDVLGRAQIPAGASAVVANVTIASATATTYLTAWSGVGGRPRPSTVNAGRGQIVANRALLPLDSAGRAALFNAAGRTDVVVDVVGYLSSNGGGSYYTPATPSRLVDRTAANVLASATVDVGTGNAVLAPSVHDLAPTTAVWLTLVGDHPTGRGYLAARPGGSAPTGTSDLNLVPGRAVANAGPATVSSAGTVQVQSVPGSRIVVDLSGWFQRRPSAPDVAAGLYSTTRYPDYTDSPTRTDTVPTTLPAYFVDGVFTSDGDRTASRGYGIASDGTVTASVHGIAHPGSIEPWGPVSPVGGLTGVTTLATAGGRAVAAVYALDALGAVSGMSSNRDGELAQPPSATITYPLTAVPITLPGIAVAIGAAQGVGYAVLADGSVYSWGRADTGQLGRTATSTPWVPAPVDGFDTDHVPTQVAGDGDVTFAIDAAGATWYWGTPVGGTAEPTPTAYPTGCDTATALHADASGVWEMCEGGVVHLSDHGTLPDPVLIPVLAYRIAAAAGVTSGLRVLVSGNRVVDVSASGEVRYEAGFDASDVQGITKINGSPGVQITQVGG